MTHPVTEQDWYLRAARNLVAESPRRARRVLAYHKAEPMAGSVHYIPAIEQALSEQKEAA